MNFDLRTKAENIMKIINELPMVKSCKLYGSIASGTEDDLSDIDIEVDVSDYDNARFMLEIPKLLNEKINVIFYDFAPSLIPEQYIVSLAVDGKNPFAMVDLKCVAESHCISVSKSEVNERNNIVAHTLKVWLANMKHYVRGRECYDDIVRMAKRLGIEAVEVKTEPELLEEVLLWLEANGNDETDEYISNCRKKFEALML